MIYALYKYVKLFLKLYNNYYGLSDKNYNYIYKYNTIKSYFSIY